MKSDYETFPDDLRLRYQFCRRLHHAAHTFPPFFSRPYTVIAEFMSGKTEIGFADRVTPPILLRAGDCCILPANCRRHGRALSPGGAEFITSGFLFEVRGGMDLLNFFDIPPRPDKRTNGILRNLIEELLGLERKSPRHTDLQKNVAKLRIGYAMLESILAISAPKPGMFASRLLLPAIEHLNANFTARPDLPKILKMSGVSRTHFFRMFKSQTGTTPIDYVKRRRLREALLLLRESDLNISEIGDKVGWPDQFYFSKLFKAEIGLSPSAYRLRHTESVKPSGASRAFSGFNM